MPDMEANRAGAVPLQSVVPEPGAELTRRLDALPTLSHAQLRSEWTRLFRASPPMKIGRDILELGVAWKLQERVLGGWGGRTKRQLAELAHEMAGTGDLTRPRAVTVRPGARLVREWHGTSHEVLVLESGFGWNGKTWRSLSAVAEAITGTNWSGPRFFGLLRKQRGRTRPRCAAPELGEDRDG